MIELTLDDLDTEVDVDVLKKDVDDFISELKEWATVCEAIGDQMNNVAGALDDPEDLEGAVEDALNNIRLLDFSGPKSMELLLPGDLDSIENRLDELRTDIGAWVAEHTVPDAASDPERAPLSDIHDSELVHELRRRGLISDDLVRAIQDNTNS